MTLGMAIKKYNEIYGNLIIKPLRSELLKENIEIHRILKKNNSLDKYCLPSKTRGLMSLSLDLNQTIEKYNEIYKKKPSVWKLGSENSTMYRMLKKHNLLDKYCTISEKKLKRIIQEYYRNYKSKPSRERLLRENKNTYEIFKEFSLLNEYCIPSKNIKIKPTRTQLKKENRGVYNTFNKNGLLEKYCLQSTRLRLDETINNYHKSYKKKPTRIQLKKQNRAMYKHFKKKNLLKKYSLPGCKISPPSLYIDISKYDRDLLINKIGNKRDIGYEFRDLAREYNISNKKLRNMYNLYKIRKSPTKPNIQEAIKKYQELYKTKPGRMQLHKENSSIYTVFRLGNILDKYCQPSRTKKQQQPNIKITGTYKPITIIPKTKKRKSGTHAKYPETLVRKEYKSKEDKVDIREKILNNIQDGDKVLLLESPDLSAIKEIEKQGKSPSKIVIPNDKEFKKLAENIKNYKTDLNIEIINTSVLQYLVDTKEKFDFVWLDYCGAFSYYIEDLDVLFQKHFNDMKLVLTYNLFDPAKDDDSYYFTRVIDYVLSKVSETNKIRLINDITYRYKKTMYNLGFEIGRERT